MTIASKEYSNLKLFKRWDPMRNYRPDFFGEPIVIDLEVRYARLLMKLWAAAAEVVTSVALATEVDSTGVDDQGTVQP